MAIQITDTMSMIKTYVKRTAPVLGFDVEVIQDPTMDVIHLCGPTKRISISKRMLYAVLPGPQLAKLLCDSLELLKRSEEEAITTAKIQARSKIFNRILEKEKSPEVKRVIVKHDPEAEKLPVRRIRLEE
jgi:hypothetical protein